jgi:hypothetical protein
MPQLLKPSTPMEFRADSVRERPELAVYIAEVAAAWVEVEVSLGLLLAVILNTEARTGVSIFLALTGSAAQEAALSAAAEARLPTELSSEFASLRSEYRTRAGERNRVVHGFWGVSPKFPDALIYCPPEHFVRDIAHAYSVVQATGIQESGPSREFYSKLRIYKSKDFADILNRIHATREAVEKFLEKVGSYYTR